MIPRVMRTSLLISVRLARRNELQERNDDCIRRAVNLAFLCTRSPCPKTPVLCPVSPTLLIDIPIPNAATCIFVLASPILHKKHESDGSLAGSPFYILLQGSLTSGNACEGAFAREQTLYRPHSLDMLSAFLLVVSSRT